MTIDNITPLLTGSAVKQPLGCRCAVDSSQHGNKAPRVDRVVIRLPEPRLKVRHGPREANVSAIAEERKGPGQGPGPGDTCLVDATKAPTTYPQ